MTRKKWLRKSKLSKQKNEWTRQAEKLLTNWFFLFSNRNLEDSYATRYGYLRWIWMTDNACWWHVFGNVMGKQLRIRLNHIIFSLATYWAMAFLTMYVEKNPTRRKEKHLHRRRTYREYSFLFSEQVEKKSCLWLFSVLIFLVFFINKKNYLKFMIIVRTRTSTNSNSFEHSTQNEFFKKKKPPGEHTYSPN